MVSTLFVIVVYDVSVDRVTAVNKFLKQYLTWMQNSVFMGGISPPKIEEVKEGLKEIIDEKEDSIIFFILPNKKILNIQTMGVEKTSTTSYNII